MTKLWRDDLEEELIIKHGPEIGKELFNKYVQAFSAGDFWESPVDVGLSDVELIETLSPQKPLSIDFYFSKENVLYLRVFQLNEVISLADILPLLENMDLRVHHETIFKFRLGEKVIWINDYVVSIASPSSIDIEEIQADFEDTFTKTYLGLAENDGFNKLVLGAQLSCREITILRAYAKYIKQAGFRFSQAYIEKTLINNPEITRDLVSLFLLKFDPKSHEKEGKSFDDLKKKILLSLEAVISLDEDKILRRYYELIIATIRTNYFQTSKDGSSKEYLSFKFKSQDVPELPLPVPLYEIFVYSTRFEGIHLRSAKVARGGLRLSDRPEDFRTEVLGLMKAQKVKNAVIVPSGAKGGFVLKKLPLQAPREVVMKEAVYCYKNFIRGLLDITDNLKDQKVIKPQQVICYDDNDTYLVVAADKGTASFSDIANEISKEYDFWLGDGFASGGSQGYDHKKMGITANGAWESIKRHFREIEIDVMQNDFTAVGVGDMSGDVFGNGMLYTPHIMLVAAFDHRHIFLDPSPNPKESFEERKRLFNLPNSSWEDYQPHLISKGGGVFKRTSKYITLTPEMRSALGIESTVNSLTPNDLIKAILKAPVDLLFNGGIGTYVKSSSESHAEVGDKTNEYCRVDGNELRCRVVGEGGNLGFTQLGRVDYALNKGLINTDFIDNSAGVDCSDHEVNIKILLNEEVRKGRLTAAERNELLASMTNEVGEVVLKDNYNQALVISYSNFIASQSISLMINYIHELEFSGVLSRAVEFLPDEKKMLDRKSTGLGLTRPELAVLLAYTKIDIQNEILNSEIPDQEFLNKFLMNEFPVLLQEKYKKEISEHSLKREIVATQLANQIVNEMGITFVYNLQIETGATIIEIISAYIVASQIFNSSELQKIIVSFDFVLPITTQYELLGYISQLIYLSTRWLIRNIRSLNEKMCSTIEHYSKAVDVLTDLVPSLMGGVTKNFFDTLSRNFAQVGIPERYARQIAGARALYTTLNIIQVATQFKFDLVSTARMYFAVGEKFNLLWFRDVISKDTREGYWESLARFTLRDELDILQKQFTVVIMQYNKKNESTERAIHSWMETHQLSMRRWKKTLEKLLSSPSLDNSMLFIALKELFDLANMQNNEEEMVQRKFKLDSALNTSRKV